MSQQHKPQSPPEAQRSNLSPNNSPQQPLSLPNQSPAQTNQQGSSWGWYYHRKREQPTPDPNESPMNQIKFYLDRYKIKEALQVFFDENTLNLLRVEPDFMWDIIPMICKRLRGLCQYRFRVFEGCERMLCRIAVDEHCNPKEVLIILLAEITQQNLHEDDNVFRAMIRPLEGTLLRMTNPTPREENFIWVLNVLIKYINSIDIPQEVSVEGKKSEDASNNPNMKRYVEVLPLLFSFIEEFNDKPVDYDKSPMPILTESQIDQVFNGNYSDVVEDDNREDLDENNGNENNDYAEEDNVEDIDDDDDDDDDDDEFGSELRLGRGDSLDASVSALTGLFYKPLAFLDLTKYCTELRLLGNRCLNSLLRIRPNIFSTIYKRLPELTTSGDTIYNQFFQDDGICSESLISVATSAYLFWCEHISPCEIARSFPQVLTHESMFLCHIPYIVCLLERSEILVHEKGLLLLESQLKRLSRNTLDRKFLDIFEVSSVNEQLFKIMVYSPLSTNRRRAYNLFTSICDLLSYECKLKLFKSVLIRTDLRPSVRAACIDQYRKYITEVYKDLLNLHQQLSTIAAEKKQNSDDSKGEVGQTDKNCNMERSDLQINDSIIEKTSDSSVMSTDLMLRMKDLHTRYRSLGGSVLTEFLDICIEACIPDSQKTDIIENYELLLATMTVLRFLKLRKKLLRDEKEDEYLSSNKLRKGFFEPVRNAITMITTEIESQGKNAAEGHRVCRLDLVESVLARTCDLYNC